MHGLETLKKWAVVSLATKTTLQSCNSCYYQFDAAGIRIVFPSNIVEMIQILLVTRSTMWTLPQAEYVGIDYSV